MSAQVWNLEPTLSINHNWINATSAEFTGAFLLRELAAVRAAIGDCKCGDDDAFEWEWLCQSVLQTNAGMNIGEWCVLLQVRPPLGDGGAVSRCSSPPPPPAAAVAVAAGAAHVESCAR